MNFFLFVKKYEFRIQKYGIFVTFARSCRFLTKLLQNKYLQMKTSVQFRVGNNHKVNI
jgi:hypothetical protein